MRILITCNKHLETLCEQEVIKFGLHGIKIKPALVVGYGEIEHVYNLCLYSRVASRILIEILESAVTTADSLYEAIFNYAWHELLNKDASISVNFSGTNAYLNNTHFSALKTKDAIVDRFKAESLPRPNIDKDDPDCKIVVHLEKGKISCSIDAAGVALHKRGYRLEHGLAPIRETLAAAMLLRAGHNADDSRVVVDPACGGATILVEAARIAFNIANIRDKWGFEGIRLHNKTLWSSIEAAAIKGELKKNIKYYGLDSDPIMINKARKNIALAGLENYIEIHQGEIENLENIKNIIGNYQNEEILMISNLPYGHRLDSGRILSSTYITLGEKLKANFVGSNVAFLSSDSELLHLLHLKVRKKYAFINGKIDCLLIVANIFQTHTHYQEQEQNNIESSDLYNRLRKNLKNLQGFIKTNSIEAYRLYDADIPEYNIAVDVYKDYIHVSEYAAPKTIETSISKQRLNFSIQVIKSIFNVEQKYIVIKERKPTKGLVQYEKQASRSQFFAVQETYKQEIHRLVKARFLVNMYDYLDTGLFLDHRPMRNLLCSQGFGKKFLNLFCYTGSATVAAALGGAVSSVNVDLSNTYLAWALDNLELNNLSANKHNFIRADVIEWLLEQKIYDKYDLIFIDPPTFSNSTKMNGKVFDIQRDHVSLIQNAMRILAEHGVLYFSNNYRKFKLDEALKHKFYIDDISHQTIDDDFKRNQKIHRVFKIMHSKFNRHV